MQAETATITLITKEGDIIKVDRRIRDYSKVIGEANEDEDIQLGLISSATLRKIISFYESYDFQVPKQNKNIGSSSHLENLGQKNLEYFKEYIKEDSKVDVDKIKNLIDGCFHYGFQELTDLTLITIGTEFFCPQTEASLEKYKREHEIGEVLPEQQIAIMKEFEDVFISLNEKFYASLEKVEEKPQPE